MANSQRLPRYRSKSKRLRILILSLSLLLVSPCGTAQVPSPHDFDSLLRVLQFCLDLNLRERIVVRTDRTLYLAGDILWLKALCRNMLSGRPVLYSNTLFVDVVNSSDSVVADLLLDLKHQQTDGAIKLEKKLPEGFFWVRGNTAEMAKEDPGRIFVMPFYSADNKGTYTITLTGITSKGETIFLKKKIFVTENSPQLK